MGDRFANLQTAIDKLFLEVGSILKISPVYETPAMGFEAQAFLNIAVLLHTDLESKRILKTLLAIEGEMGRERTNSKEYRSRPIDIDIIFLDDMVIHTELLTVPHPRMKERKFVLQPLFDLDGSFVHPVLGTSVGELLRETTDHAPISKQAKWLTNPLHNYNISRFNFIAVEGNIGVGKTSLATKIATDFNAKLILERFKDNPFLPKFYEDADRYAFPLEMSFLADRYQQLVEGITQFDLFKELILSDYDINKSLIFAGITLAEDEKLLYRKLFQLMYRELPKPDVYVYLYQSTERLLENIKKRGRKYEKSIPKAYLEKLNSGYFEFIKSQPPASVRVIDLSEMDFVSNRSDYLAILKQISD